MVPDLRHLIHSLNVDHRSARVARSSQPLTEFSFRPERQYVRSGVDYVIPELSCRYEQVNHSTRRHVPALDDPLDVPAIDRRLRRVGSITQQREDCQSVPSTVGEPGSIADRHHVVGPDT